MRARRGGDSNPEFRRSKRRKKRKKKMDFSSEKRKGGHREVLLRVVAAAATFCAAIVMGLNKQTIDLYGVDLQAKFYYSPAFTFFVVANATAAAYSLFSLAICFTSNCKERFPSARKWLFFFDFVMSLVVTAGNSATTAIGYVGWKGNDHTGWMKICDHFDIFCYRVGGAQAAAYTGLLIFVALTVASAGFLSG